MNWDLERQIWQRLLHVTAPNLVPRESGLVLTEPLMNLPALQEETYQASAFLVSCSRPPPSLLLPIRLHA